MPTPTLSQTPAQLADLDEVRGQGRYNDGLVDAAKYSAKPVIHLPSTGIIGH
jgi:hypothetical protein